MSVPVNPKKRRVVVVGGVAGGATFAARMRRLDEHAQITLFERGPFISFANCGLPYHISGVIEDRDELILQTPESFGAKFQVPVFVEHEVVAIDRQKKTVRVQNLKAQQHFDVAYDHLILAPGAKPFVPPIPGIEQAHCYRLRTVPDLDRILAHLQKSPVQHAVVLGGGFIGVEVAENLKERGIATTLVEMAPQVLTFLDPEMAALVHRQLRAHGVQLVIGDGAAEIKSQSVRLASGQELPADLIIAAIGVRPEDDLAVAAGLEVNARGGIVVNEYQQTSDPAIFAVGDACQIQNLMTGQPTLLPLAGPANRQARVVADHLCGLPSSYAGGQGTSILKVFDLQVAATGLNEKSARQLKIPYQAIHLHHSHHVGYYPGAQRISLKVLFDPNSGRLLGGQAIGGAGVDRRIDLLAMACRLGLRIEQLAECELAYAPPFGAAKDPINMVGTLGENLRHKLVQSITEDQIAAQLPEAFRLDVRGHEEVAACGAIPGATILPLSELRAHLLAIPRDKAIVINCQSGVRSYNACRILMQSGFDPHKIFNLSGGYLTYSLYQDALHPLS